MPLVLADRKRQIATLSENRHVRKTSADDGPLLSDSVKVEATQTAITKARLTESMATSFDKTDVVVDLVCVGDRILAQD